MYTVYKHTSPDGRVYIGITRMKPEQRWARGKNYKCNTYFTRTVEKYGWDNFTHEILADGLTEQEAKEMEIALIKKHRSNERKYGFNISSGGESKAGTKISETQKERIRESNIGKIVSEETRKKLSVSSKRRWQNKEYIEHMKAINKGENNKRFGVKLTDEEKKIRGAMQINQYTKNGEFVCTYISIHEASNRTGISRCDISNCCKGKYKQAGGYVWKYDKTGTEQIGN